MSRTSLPAVITVLWFSLASARGPDECIPGASFLCLRFAPEISEVLSQDFISGATRNLSESLREIGYCLRFCTDPYPLQDSTLVGSIVIRVGLEEGSDHTTPVITVGFALLQSMDSDLDRLPGVRYLVRFPLETGDYTDIHSVLATKIVEDFRTHYLCHLHISSVPPGAGVVTASGLSGMTPLEWVVPVGTLPVTVTKEKFRQTSTIIRLDRPGDHTVVMTLARRRFYNSPFLYPLMVSLTASGALFAAEAYYYREYRNLGENDYYHRPELFGEKFRTARTLERAAVAALACSGVFFICSLSF